MLAIFGLGASIVIKILSKKASFKSTGCGQISGLSAVFRRITQRLDSTSPGLFATGLTGLVGAGSLT